MRVKRKGIIMNEKKRGFLYRLSAKFGRLMVYTFMRVAFRPKLIFESKEAKDTLKSSNYIFIGNHVGHHDGQMFYTVLKHAQLLIAKDWADKGFVDWVIYGANFIKVDRAGMDITWISAAREGMSQGKNTIIFPEGHTSKGEMDEFKPGFAMLAVLANAKIVPIYNNGEYHKFFGKRLRLYVGNPVELTAEGKGLSADYLKAESERMQKIVQSMKDEHTKIKEK